MVKILNVTPKTVTFFIIDTLKNKTHPYIHKDGKNCYEKEKLPLIRISDNSNITFFLKI